MGENSKIEWTDHTFNPWTGCTKVSPACANCYAEAWAKRTGIVKWGDSAERRRTSDANWRQPLIWDREAAAAGEIRRVFCASLADVGEDRPELKPWRKELMQLVMRTRNLFWLFLTKRPENMPRLLGEAARGMHWNTRNHLGIGTTVESKDYVRRIDYLMHCRPWASVLFLSCEPLLSEIDLFPWLHAVDETAGFDYNMGIDWVIAGGESGPRARPSHPDWFRSLRDQCVEAGVPFHFKQWGEFAAFPHGIGPAPSRHSINLQTKAGLMVANRVGKKAAGRLLDGVEWNQFPATTGMRAEEV